MITGKAAARCPGTCGEWVQGAKSGKPFLVDCPIDRYAEAVVETDPTGKDWHIPQGKEKAREALSILRQEQGFSGGGILSFRRELPAGKGMASSTADIVSAAAALAFARGETVSSGELAHLAFLVEPSDSVMYPGITEIDHLQGSYYKILGSVVPAGFLALDWGGEVDTLRFNARTDLRAHYQKHEHTIAKALTLLQEGIHSADLEKMATASTLSARCNLEINPKPCFDLFRAWILAQGGLGVVTAHSGTLLAGVFPAERELKPLLETAAERFAPVFADTFQARGGGVELSPVADTDISPATSMNAVNSGGFRAV